MVLTLRAQDRHIVADFAPDIAILEIGTNDLSCCRLEVVGSAIKDVMRLLLEGYSVCVVGVCHVIPCGISPSHSVFSPASIAFPIFSFVLVIRSYASFQNGWWYVVIPTSSLVISAYVFMLHCFGLLLSSSSYIFMPALFI